MKYSVKKSLGSLGTVVIYGIALYVIWKEPTQVGNVLWPLIVYVAALFGLKKIGTKVIGEGK